MNLKTKRSISMALSCLVALSMLAGCKANNVKSSSSLKAALSASTNVSSSSSSGLSSSSSLSSSNKASGLATSSKPNSSNTASGSADPYGKYSQPITMNIVRTDINPTNLPSPDTITSNGYLRLIKQSLNIDVKYSTLVGGVSDYDTKINLLLASNSIPDVMYIDNASQLDQLSKTGMISDLTTVYKNYASPVTKAFYSSYATAKDSDGLATCTFGGKLQALPNTNLGLGYSLLWIRKDWMDKLNEPAPKSLSDIITIAKDFKAKDPGGNGVGKTIGIPVSKYLIGYNQANSLDTLFASFGAYPGQWVKNSSGRYVYGSVAPEAKTALIAIADMYKQGAIDPQFVTDDPNAVISSGRCGMMFGPWWMPYNTIGNLYKANQHIDWEPYMVPLAADGKSYQPLQKPHTAWIVVNKKYAHPDAVVKVLNIQNLGTGQTAKTADTFPNTNVKIIDGIYKSSLNVSWCVWPFPIQIIWNDNQLRVAKDVMNAVSKKTTPDNPSFNATVAGILGFNANPYANTTDTLFYDVYKAMSLEYNNNSIVKYPNMAFPTQTTTMTTKMPNLYTLESQAYLRIITGGKPISYFDDFVSQWNAQGGTQITSEVNTQLK
jgi:putative aldouronate transport system substrate-binding protein